MGVLRGRLRAIGDAIGLMIQGLAAFIVGLWLLGLIVSDRSVWGQWLLWIPSVAPLACVGLAIATAPLARRPRRSACVWSMVFMGIVIPVGVWEHRLLRTFGGSEQLRGTPAIEVLHWNLRWVGDDRAEQFVEFLDSHLADVTIISNPGRLTAKSRGLRWTARGLKVLNIGDFVVVTHLDVIDAYTMTGADSDAELGVLTVHAGDSSRKIQFLLVDLPSFVTQSRMDIAGRVRAVLGRYGAPSPDIVVGDFNTTSGSAAIAHMFRIITMRLQTLAAGGQERFRDGVHSGASISCWWPIRSRLARIVLRTLGSATISLNERWLALKAPSDAMGELPAP